MNEITPPYQPLIEIYQDPEISNNARELHEAMGVICAISASPESIELQDWLPSLWLQGLQPSFSNEALAIDFAEAVFAFYEHCQQHYYQNQPLDVASNRWIDDAGEVTEQGIAFASGYLFAFHSIERAWGALNLPDGSKEEQLLQTSLLLLSKMATPNTTDPEMKTLFLQLPEIIEIVAVLPQLLAAVGHYSVQANNDE